MKRKEGESFKDYQERRRLDHKFTKKYLKGRKIKFTKKEIVENFKGDIKL